MNVAILVGNTQYSNLGALDCCEQDLIAMRELIERTEKFNEIHSIINKTSPAMKDEIRRIIKEDESYGEIFFYFTGHGYQNESDFYYCSTNFDSKRPNETGLSNSDLHLFFKSCNPDLVVKVIDACNSGLQLIKSDAAFPEVQKGLFKNIIQIASCLDSQNSLAGSPLSVFTEKFRDAALRKTEGAVYYSDIIDALRDEFLGHSIQTPYFVYQGTNREQFSEDARRFNIIRESISSSLLVDSPRQLVDSEESNSQILLRKLKEIDSNYADRGVAEAYIVSFFEEISRAFTSDNPFSEMYSFDEVRHEDFQESATKTFIVSVLSSQNRPDSLVYANSRREDESGIQLSYAVALAMGQKIKMIYDLRLNCELPEVQMKITFTPKYKCLKQYKLIVTCAPSLDTCYVFEYATVHSMTNWDSYESSGKELNRRWYKLGWKQSSSGVVKSIYDYFYNAIDEHIKKIGDDIRNSGPLDRPK